MKNLVAFITAIALSSSGVTLAGMQDQGAGPEGKQKPEYTEKNPGGYRTHHGMSKIKAQFESLDKDKDGCLTKQELSSH